MLYLFHSQGLMCLLDSPCSFAFPYTVMDCTGSKQGRSERTGKVQRAAVIGTWKSETRMKESYRSGA